MSSPDDEENPFERYDLDPEEGLEGLTEALRERIDDAETEAERRALRGAWQALTLHPERRLEAALGAHPAHPLPLGAPPAAPSPRRPPDEVEASLHDLLLRPGLAELLPEAEEGPLTPPIAADPALED